jgi:hypothetical protein
LWKAAASGGTQDNDTHGRLPRDGAGGAKAYFTMAQAYELISRPTAISTIRGFVHMVISHDHHNRVL